MRILKYTLYFLKTLFERLINSLKIPMAFYANLGDVAPVKSLCIFAVVIGQVHIPNANAIGTSQFSESFQKEFQLKPYRYLRKISRKVRGIDPSNKEYDALEAVLLSNSSEKLDSFYKEQVRLYLNDPRFVEKMVYRISALLNVETKYVTRLKNGQGIDKRSKDLALYSLVRNIVETNSSWDMLLTADKYEVTEAELDFYSNLIGKLTFISELDYYGNGVLKSPSTLPKKYISFPEDANQIGGILSTKTWRDRFNVDNDDNENRRNASAVYRVFLCDPMIPNIESSTEKDQSAIKKILEVAKNKLSSKKSDQSLKSGVEEFVSVEQKHGTDSSCMGCHVKLDPAGLTFGDHTLKLPQLSPKGRLFFNYSKENQSDVEVDGLKGLGEEITKTSRYADCQVDHFWKWFISKDIKFSPNKKKKEELIKKFNSVNRRVKDFVEYLVLQPEFSIDYFKALNASKTIAYTYDQVKPILERCNSCHSNEGYIFTDVSAEFRGTDSDVKRLKDMQLRLLREPKEKGAMPQSRASFKNEELEAVLSWISSELDEK